LPARILLAGKLLEEVRACVDARYATTEQLDSCRRDLRPLYEQLRRLFEANNGGIILKNARIIQDKASQQW